MALAKTAGVRRQTLQEWYSGSSVPRLAELAEVARALGVRRVDLVAAYDGVTAPDTAKEPRPEWAEALVTKADAAELARQLEEQIRTNRETVVRLVARQTASETAKALEALPQQLLDALSRAAEHPEE